MRGSWYAALTVFARCHYDARRHKRRRRRSSRAWRLPTNRYRKNRTRDKKKELVGGFEGPETGVDKWKKVRTLGCNLIDTRGSALSATLLFARTASLARSAKLMRERHSSHSDDNESFARSDRACPLIRAKVLRPRSTKAKEDVKEPHVRRFKHVARHPSGQNSS